MMMSKVYMLPTGGDEIEEGNKPIIFAQYCIASYYIVLLRVF